MVKVTLEFPSVDAAIVALSKLSSVVAKVSAPAPLPPASPESLTPGKVRKPRSDAGQPRGSRKNAEAVEKTPEPQASVAAVSAPNVEAPETTGASQSDRGTGTTGSTLAPMPAASAPKEEDAQAALAKVFEAHGLPRAQEVLARHGVTRLRDLLPEQRAGFIEEAEKVAAEKK